MEWFSLHPQADCFCENSGVVSFSKYSTKIDPYFFKQVSKRHHKCSYVRFIVCTSISFICNFVRSGTELKFGGTGMISSLSVLYFHNQNATILSLIFVFDPAPCVCGVYIGRSGQPSNLRVGQSKLSHLGLLFFQVSIWALYTAKLDLPFA